MVDVKVKCAAIARSVLKGVRRILGVIGNFHRKAFQNRKAAAGYCILLFFILTAVFGPLIFPYNQATVFEDRYLSASWAHPFGTDEKGRDIFRMLIDGSRSVLSIALLTGIFTIVLGTFLGILSGFVGGITDKIIQTVTNLLLTIPSLPVILMLAALITIKDSLTFALILTVWGWAPLCRALRAQVMSLKERDFIQICRVMRMNRAHIIVKELTPNLFSYIAVNFVLIMRNAITGSMGIMILGLAAFEPTNWGAMLYHARELGLISSNVINYMLKPLAAVVLFQMGAVLFANGLDEILNPRLRLN